MSQRVKIFISHAWDRSDLYRDLVQIINSVPDLEWEDLSIPEDHAVELATGEEGVSQRRLLLEQRFDALSRRWSHLRLAKGERVDRNLSISQISEEIDKLSSDMAICRRQFADLDVAHLAKRGTSLERMYSEYPNLAMAISNRIAEADVVVLVALRRTPFLPWVEFEYKEALHRRKLVFGVLPDAEGNELAPDLRLNGIPLASWSSSSLQQHLQTACSPRAAAGDA